MSNTVPAVVTNYRTAIERAAADPNFDLEKFERLVAVQETIEQRAADLSFNEALAEAQAAMMPIRADSTNPQTRSRYASYAALYREVQPIYAQHDFSVSFTTEPAGDTNTLMVVGILMREAVSRRYQIPMPIDTKGARGQDVMTRTHATISAISYAKRHLLCLMFNIAVDADDDGNAAGRHTRPFADEPAAVTPPAPPEGHHATYKDEATGKILDEVTPFSIDWLPGDTPRSWGEKLIACLRGYCRSLRDVDDFIALNLQQTAQVLEAAPNTHKVLQASINDIRKKYE